MKSRVMVLAAVAMLPLAACGEKTSDEPTQREQIGQSWKYETKSGVPIAYIGSANSVQTMDAPDSFAVLLLQKMKNGETGVTIKSVGTPFTCDLSDCMVNVTIDGGEAKEWHGRMAETKDGIELPPSQNAFDSIKDAKSVQVTLDLGKQGKHPFIFSTAGFAWPKS